MISNFWFYITAENLDVLYFRWQSSSWIQMISTPLLCELIVVIMSSCIRRKWFMNSSIFSLYRWIYVSLCTSSAVQFWAYPNRYLNFSKSRGKFGVASILIVSFAVPVSFWAMMPQRSSVDWLPVTSLRTWMCPIKDSTLSPSNSGIRYPGIYLK